MFASQHSEKLHEDIQFFTPSDLFNDVCWPFKRIPVTSKDVYQSQDGGYNNVNVYVYTFYTYYICKSDVRTSPEAPLYSCIDFVACFCQSHVLLIVCESLRRMQCDHCHARLGPEGRDEFESCDETLQA